MWSAVKLLWTLIIMITGSYLSWMIHANYSRFERFNWMLKGCDDTVKERQQVSATALYLQAHVIQFNWILTFIYHSQPEVTAFCCEATMLQYWTTSKIIATKTYKRNPHYYRVDKLHYYCYYHYYLMFWSSSADCSGSSVFSSQAMQDCTRLGWPYIMPAVW